MRTLGNRVVTAVWPPVLDYRENECSRVVALRRVLGTISHTFPDAHAHTTFSGPDPIGQQNYVDIVLRLMPLGQVKATAGLKRIMWALTDTWLYFSTTLPGGWFTFAVREEAIIRLFGQFKTTQPDTGIPLGYVLIALDEWLRANRGEWE